MSNYFMQIPKTFLSILCYFPGFTKIKNSFMIKIIIIGLIDWYYIML